MPPPIVTAALPYIWQWLKSRFTRKPTRGRRAKGGGSLVSVRSVLVLALVAAGVWLVAGDRIKAWLRENSPFSWTETAAQDGAIRVYFTNPGGDPADPNNIAHAVAGYIDAAKTSIDVAAYELDNKLIVEALVRAHRRGVKVRLVTDTDYAMELGPETLRSAGIPVVEDRREALMHNKFMVFDGTAVWTGSMNFTENCAYKNDNHGLYLAVPEVAENYATKFRWMFEERAFGKLPHAGAKIPHPVVKLPDGTIIETYFAPHDRPADKMIAAIGETRKTLDFLAFSFTHDGIGRAVENRARAGVVIRGVFEKSQAASGHSEYGYFKSLGLSVFLDANPRNMHHKAMILDDQTTLGGSFNFSANADKSNDENLVIIRGNPAVAEKFESEFRRIYDAAKAAEKE